ncbi:T9SS type A sorting domain-containing protein [Patiriisocius hiemis]|uniref:T9SS type A sorting domain-containing protein n=1 Tax=Patiriisocius hiemis TaxID=3075604 RepID=A0ABU2YCS4_9FLAO|nr:T9SS type A sorting domain-containing protein [Constantimarinum sp. W242]MDT0555055.1 T9SS type A sorting domain-containing protein [Constantimarinum sp. W242]
MKKFLVLLCTMTCSISFGQEQIGTDIDGENINDRIGKSVVLARNGSRVSIGGDKSPNGLGSVSVYDFNGTDWVQVGNTIFGENELDQIGNHVSMSNNGDIIAIGAPLSDELGNNTGQVRVFQLNNGVWEPLGNKLIGEQDVDRFGSSVSLSANGTILAVGALSGTGNMSDSGYVKVYEWDGAEWVQKGSKVNGNNFFDYFGAAVSFSEDGNRLAIGAYKEDDDGRVYIFEWNGSDWSQLGNTLQSASTNADRFGSSLEISGNGETVIIGDLWDDTGGNQSGTAQVFKYNGSIWNQVGATITAVGFGDHNGWGVSISFNGNTIAVSSPKNSTNSFEAGSVRIFQLNNGNWVQSGNTIYGEGSNDKCGQQEAISLSRNGEIVAIGAEFNDNEGQGYGHARVFNLSNILSTNSTTSKKFQFFPNPTSAKITFENIDSANVNIYNSIGQFLEKKTIENHSLNISNLADGIYFLKINTQDAVETVKIIKK